MKAVLSTRPEAASAELAGRLAAAGRRLISVPMVAIEPLPVPRRDLAGYDWVAVTSANGAALLLDALDSAAGPRWAAVGPATAAVLERRGIRVDAVPGEANGEAIAGAIAAVEDPRGRRVLLARADIAASDLPDRLREMGARVDEIAVYRTVEGPEDQREAARGALADPELGVIVFASGSAVRGLLRLAGEAALKFPAVTIGPRTAEAAARAGFKVAAVAKRPTIESLVEALQDVG